MRIYFCFAKYIICTIVLGATMIVMLFLGIVCYPNDVFRSTWNSIIQDKFENLLDTNVPKIIMVAGSSSAFGLDEKMLEEETGYKVVNLGLYAGFGQGFYTWMARSNINPGDIVLLGYEPGWNTRSFNTIGIDTVMCGIDDDIRMYLYSNPKWYSQFLGYLFAFAEKKNQFEPVSGFWSRESFDAVGNMDVIMDQIADYNDENSERLGIIDVRYSSINEDVKEYLFDFNQYVESRGGICLFVASPVLEEAIRNDFSIFEQIKINEESEIGIPYISNPIDYIFPKELMTSDPNHPNYEGREYRTHLLIGDLRSAGIID